MYPPDLLHCNPPSLLERLRQRTNKLRARIVRANYNTRFAQAAPELDEFRRATGTVIDGMDEDTLSDVFRQAVQFTSYDSYAPFVSMFFERPCKSSAIIDLLAPGLPDYLAQSSSTSGGLPKTFPRYNQLSEIRSSNNASWIVSDPVQKRTMAYVWYLGYDEMHVEEEDNRSTTTIYVTFVSALDQRSRFYLDPEKDREKMGTFILDHVAPYATGFIKNWRSFLLVHALFALGSRSLRTMSMVFINTFVDMIRHLDAEFDMLVDCIENGIVPDLDGVKEARHHLEPNISPDPERAEELRSLGRPSSRQGWCSHVWPALRSVSAICSGSFASSVPLARWYLGPDIEIYSFGYGSTESFIGVPYNPADMNQFKPTGANLIEFLDVSKDGDSIGAIVQPWEVEAKGRYELVLTTQDGLWRYRLGDVVDIAGFDPTDGEPIIRFVERRNVTIRFPDFMVTENELRAAVSSVPLNMLGHVVDWTATIDDRRVPTTIGFFIELADDHVPDLALGAPDCLFEELSRSNVNIAWAFANEVFRKPTLRLVRSGTFSDFRQLKLDEGSNNLGQVKVPVVLTKASYVLWLSDRVIREL